MHADVGLYGIDIKQLACGFAFDGLAHVTDGFLLCVFFAGMGCLARIEDS